MKTKLSIYQTISLIELFSLAISIASAITSAGSQISAPLPNKATQNPGKIKYLSLKGTNVALNTLYFCPDLNGTLNFQPNGLRILQDLGINLIRVGGGTEGDVAHFNAMEHPDDWAQNIESFLALAQAHNILVTFVTMGTVWGTLFGVVCPEPYDGLNGTSIAESKAIIDKLAGDNTLHHNFIADPRIFAWSVANEVDLNNPVTLNWCLSILDYVRSKGGKAFISSPYNSSLSSDWTASMDLHYIERILGGHADFLEIHCYHDSIAATAQELGKSVYTVVYNDMHYYLSNYFVSGRGNTPLENLILGEFGIWHGYGVYGSVTANFTDESVSDYYRAVYDCAIDLGIRYVINHNCFAQKDSSGNYVGEVPWWCVDVDGSYISAKTSVIKEYA